MGESGSQPKTKQHGVPNDIDPEYARVHGSHVHNLQAVDVAAPRDAFVAFTGVSGSGKSSLAFETIYAEAQRRYFELVAPVRTTTVAATDAPKVDDYHRAAAGRRASAAPGIGNVAVDRRDSDNAVDSAANALLALGHYPPGATERIGFRRVLAEHRGRCVPGMSRPWVVFTG